MTTTEQKNFLGIPIEGEITRANQAKKQLPFEELQQEIAKLLTFETFTSLRWTQYTPYFNDGDPCVFSAHGARLRVPEDEDVVGELGEYEDGYEDADRSYVSSYYSSESNEVLDKFLGRRIRAKRDWVNGVWTIVEPGGWEMEPDDKDMVEQAIKVSRMIESGQYDVGLMEVFGDHATVTLHRDKIEVEYYEHD